VEPAVWLRELLGPDTLLHHPSGGWSPRDAESLLKSL
jgi:hypothetical protein